MWTTMARTCRSTIVPLLHHPTVALRWGGKASFVLLTVIISPFRKPLGFCGRFTTSALIQCVDDINGIDA